MAKSRPPIFLNFITTLFIFTTIPPPITTHKTNPPPKFPCKPPHYSSYPFCNTSLPIQTRAQSLITLLTLREKINQLSNGAASIPRLGIPAYQWWSESLHGIASNGPGILFNGSITAATSFPQVIVTAASYNRSIWFSIAAAIGVEARAMYNVGQAGLTFWAPNINIFRDPRWGRGQETPGEDPMLTAAYAVEYVKGFQGEFESGTGSRGSNGNFGQRRALEVAEESGGLKLSACCKHYTAYDLEDWGNFTRYTFNAKVSKQDMEETYEPPFRSCIEEGHASCLMCAYNQVNGIPMCARHDLLKKARTDWGFEGYITSDCDAVAIIYEDQRYAQSPEDAVEDVLKAGMDINCGTYLLRYTESAVEQGKVKEKDIDRALFNLFSVQLRLGLFDGDPSKQKFGKLGPQDVCTTEHRELALEAARQGIVLLKNNKKFLPLNKNRVSSLAIVGPTANDTTNLGGGYTGVPCNPKSLFRGLKDHIQETSYATGCLNVSCYSNEGFEEAVKVAGEADIVVVVAGLDLSQETEDHDRISLLLPGKQKDLITAIANASRRPLVLVLMGGGPIDVSFAKDDSRIASIIWVGYPGEAGGQALAEIILGEVNPGGRLPITWYPESFTDVPMDDMRMRADRSRGYPGRTYRFYTGEVVYGFGYGLSYSTYSYRFLSAPDKISLLGSGFKADRDTASVHERKDRFDHIYVEELTSCDLLKFYVQVSVINNGDMDGSHVVMLFARAASNYRGAPQKQLIKFIRVHTETSKATETSFTIDPCKHFSTVNDAGLRILSLGTQVLMLEGIEHHVSVEI